MKNILLVGIGGMLGSVLRYLAALLIKQGSFPLATLSVNIMGSLLIGAIMGWSVKQPDAEYWRLLLATGICGGYIFCICLGKLANASATALRVLLYLYRRHTYFITYCSSNGLLAYKINQD